MTLEQLFARADAKGRKGSEIGPDSPVDFSRWFICPTLTPLYYTSLYRQLSPAQALRYNQIAGMSFSELNLLFEQSLAGTTLAALSQNHELSGQMIDCLGQFVREEARHCELWWQLNRLCAPDRYRQTPFSIIRIPPAVLRVLRSVARRPQVFPMVLWLMLALEEHSIEISRRCARVEKNVIEPHFAAIYRMHLEDEVRHVQLDWHLLEQVYMTRSPGIRKLNAFLFRFLLRWLFLRPTGSAMRVIDLLIAEFPELKSLRPAIFREFRALEWNIDYQRMMYSRSATPIMFSLFDRLPEFRNIGKVLLDYNRPEAETAIGAGA